MQLEVKEGSGYGTKPPNMHLSKLVLMWMGVSCNVGWECEASVESDGEDIVAMSSLLQVRIRGTNQQEGAMSAVRQIGQVLFFW